MTIKKLAAIISLAFATNVFAAPMEQIDLGVFDNVNGGDTYDVGLGSLHQIPYTVTCHINNSTGNNALPIEFYPKTGSLKDIDENHPSYIRINNEPAGTGKSHNQVNIPVGDVVVEMALVTKDDNTAVVVKNDSTDKNKFITITECHANS